MARNQNQKNGIPNTLLKFKSLDKDSIRNIKETIENNKIRCSKLWRLNDAMEGVYMLSVNDLSKLDSIYYEKDQYFICSFTHPDSLESPLFWGYYANGFKGIAIEIELHDDDKKHFRKVKYVKSSPSIVNNPNMQNDAAIIKIITTKLKCWEPENEYRYIIKENVAEKVYYNATIKKIYIGYPYRNTVNCEQITENSEDLINYHKCRTELEQFCETRSMCFENFPRKTCFS